MKWQEARALFPNRWLLVSPITTHDVGEEEIWDEGAIIENFLNSSNAMLAWYRYQQANPAQSSLPVNTTRDQINIHKMSRGIGLRVKDEN